MTQSITKSRADFDAQLLEHHLSGEWRLDEFMSTLGNGPKPAGRPYRWEWPLMQRLLREASEVIPQSFTARRTLNMLNPDLPKPGTTHTIFASMQLVLPGEVAWAHRHTFNALRFAIEGTEQLYTAVSGERFIMEPGDLILNPTMAWHDHHNEGSEPGIWLDVLDVPLGFTLNQALYQPYGETTHPLAERPSGLPYRFPWADAKAKLDATPETPATPFTGFESEYRDPLTGNGVFPSMGCYLVRLPPGFEGREQRLSTSAVYFVVSGAGATLVPDGELTWNERDTFAVPNWLPHRFVNRSSTETILFKVDDRPIIAAAGFLREDR